MVDNLFLFLKNGWYGASNDATRYRGINALPKKFISHGSAANNTVRQIFASLGAAIMVGVMSATIAKYTGDQTVKKEENILLEATVNGLNNGFMIAFILIIIAFILCFFYKTAFYNK
ncbi:hypothetical protein RCO48_20310 [Peribacillus frigoritolerans]|nr:hypothetical protein [Peribacillus frigoritolerans]